MDKAAIGALEVYFQGVRLFSKIQSGKWPHPELLAQKCKRAYDDLMAGNDVGEYETQLTVKKPMDMLGGNMSVKDTLSNFDFMS